MLENPESQELFLSLDDMSDVSETAPINKDKDEIVFELEDTPQQVEKAAPTDISAEIEGTPEEMQTLFLEETDEVDPSPADKSTEPSVPIFDEKTSTEIKKNSGIPGVVSFPG